MSIQIHACNIIPAVGGGGGTALAPYLLAGPDPSGTLTNAVNVLAMTAAQQPVAFQAVEEFQPASNVGLPLAVAYLPPVVGANGQSVALPFQLKDDSGVIKNAAAVVVETRDAAAASYYAALTFDLSAGGPNPYGVELVKNTLKLLGSSTLFGDTDTCGVYTEDANFLCGSNRQYNAPVVGAVARVLARCVGDVAARARAELVATSGDGTNPESESGFRVERPDAQNAGEARVRGCDVLQCETPPVTADFTICTSGNVPLKLLTNGKSGKGWEVTTSGDLSAVNTGPSLPKVTNMRGGTVSGEAVEFSQVFTPSLAVAPSTVANQLITASLRTQTINIAAKNTLQSFPFTVPYGLRIIGCRAALPAAVVPDTVDVIVRNAAGVALFEILGKQPPGGTVVPCAATYTDVASVIAQNDAFSVEVQTSLNPFVVYVFLEFAPA